jgi:hypothetical protein
MSLLRSLPGRAHGLLAAEDDRDDWAISMAAGLLVARLRLSREMALEILRRQARTKRQRMSQVAKDLLRSVEHANSMGAAASQRARDTADS